MANKKQKKNGGGAQKNRHKENKLDDNGLPKTIETADGVNCRVGPESEREKREREGKQRECQRGLRH